MLATKPSRDGEFSVETSEPSTSTWARIPGVAVDGTTLTIDPDLTDVTADDVTVLRESATLAALNRVELSGDITDRRGSSPVGATARVVYDLDADDAERVDDLYHGGFFNEYRRVEAVKAHAALGGRLVHGCQSSANMSGGAAVPYGVDLDRLRAERTPPAWTTPPHC